MTVAVIQDRDKRNGAIATILFHILLAIFFILFGLQQPNPLPEEVGVEMMLADYGFTDSGSGEVETESREQVQPTPEPEPTQSEVVTPTATEEVATQTESEVSVPESTEEPVEEKPAEPTISAELQRLLDQASFSGGSPGEGPTDDPGNQGIESGNPEGMGTFDGTGIGYDLGHRGHMKGPDVIKEHKEEGKVVLNIYVDRKGKVIRTTPYLAGSTTTSQALFNLASKMAKSAVFKSDANAPPEQKGKMTFVFVLE